MSNFITSDWLNLRSEPLVKKGNVLGIMPPDTVVEKLEESNEHGWYKVKVVISKTVMQGYASAKYLQETDKDVHTPTETTPRIAEAHLKTNRVIPRGSTEGRAYPLNEPSLKKANLAELSAEERKTAIHNMLNYLDVEHSVRYAPTSKSTYCNIYATDLAYCLGLYIPRVWWNNEALTHVLKEEKLEAIYEKTVLELNANSLANWFESYGAAFKWKRMLNISSLQDEVNKGSLGIIVAQRIDLNRSGHIVAVVPERSDINAKRDNGHLVSPLQSQAGVKNKKYFTGNNWWEQPNKFRKFSFWVWEG